MQINITTKSTEASLSYAAEEAGTSCDVEPLTQCDLSPASGGITVVDELRREANSSAEPRGNDGGEAEMLTQYDSCSASCGGTVVDDLRRDVRPSTSLSAAFSSRNTSQPTLSASVVAETPGAIYLEHFSVLRREDGKPWELGRGAMGVTYKALDTRLHCHVALKSINADLLARSPEAHERFLREARAAARLRHPNIASVFHLGETPDGQTFYAMEFIDGETLDARVRRRGPLSAGLTLEIGIEVTRALIAAGQQGLIHRDLKPANLMLVAGVEEASMQAAANPLDGGSAFGGRSDAGEPLVKVIDFGLAKAAADSGNATRADAFLGTPQFASPEQFADNEAAADARSDIYSLGATLWFALTGKLPFRGRTATEVRTCQLSQKLPIAQLSDAKVPNAVAELLAAMLAPDAADRPQTPYALLEALRRCRAQLLTVAPAPAATPTPVPPKAPLRLPRAVPPQENFAPSGFRLALMVVISALILAGGVAGMWYLHAHNPASQKPIPAATQTAP